MNGFSSWRTSTRTQGQGQCVEVAFAEDTVAVRDTKDRAVEITVTRRQWREFLDLLRRDLLPQQERGE